MKQFYYESAAAAKRLVMCALLFLFPASLLAARQINTSAVPGWVENVSLGAESFTKPEDVSDGYAYLLRDYQFNVARQTKFYHLARKIYSSTGLQQGSEIEVTYDPTYERVIFHQITIIRGHQQINKLDISKFNVMRREKSKESYIYDGSLSALLILEDVRAGDMIEYAFSVVGSNPIHEGKFFNSFYLAFYDPLDKLLIKVITPTHRPLHIKSQHTTVQPIVTEDGTEKVYRWDIQRTPGMATDGDVPQWYNPYPQVWLSEFSSWKEVNDWALRLYTQPVQPGKALQQAIVSIRKTGKTPGEQVEMALRLVQEEVRYTGLESGIGGYKPRDPSQVFEQKFGDCKDKARLLSYILRQMNIEAYPALVNTTYRQEIQHWLPSPEAFDHCVVRVQLLGKTYWYDPTRSGQGGAYDNIYFPGYGYALVINEATAELTAIPAPKNKKIKVVETLSIPDMSSAVDWSITTEYVGFEADQQRYHFGNYNLKEIEKDYLNYNAKHHPEIEVAKPLLTSDNRKANVFTTYENYKIVNFWYAADSTQLGSLACFAYPQSLRDKISKPERPIRTMPLYLEFPLAYEYTIHFLLPEKWSVGEERQEIKNDYTHFQYTTSYKNEVITVKYAYKTLKDHVAAKETPAFSKQQNKIIDQLGYSLTYNYNQVGNSSDFRLNWLIVLLMVIFVAVSTYGAYRIYYQFDPQPEQLYTGSRPRELGGWLVLIGLGLLISPFTILYVILSNEYFNLENWENITNASSPSYNLSLSSLIVGELLYNIVLLAFSILLIAAFLNRRSNFPLLLSIRYGGSILFLGLETYLMHEMGLLDKEFSNDMMKEITKLIIGGAIWVPYVFLSERAKETFVRTSKVPEDRQQVFAIKR